MKSEAKNRTQQFLAVWSSFFPQWHQKKYKVEFESLYFCDFTKKMLTNLFLPDWNHTKYLVKWQGCKNQKTILTTLCLVFNFTCYDFALLFCHDRGVLLLIIHLLSNFDLLIAHTIGQNYLWRSILIYGLCLKQIWKATRSSKNAFKKDTH